MNRRAAALVAALWAVAALPAQAEPDLGPALVKVRAQDWPGALVLLTPITATGCPALALYLSGFSSAKLGDARSTLKAEARALGCAPPLEAAYREGAGKLMTWAAETLAAKPSFTFGGTMSVAGRYDFAAADRFASHDPGANGPSRRATPPAVADLLNHHRADSGQDRNLVREGARQLPGLEQAYVRARNYNAMMVAQCADPDMPQSLRYACPDWLANGVEPPQTPQVALPEAATPAPHAP
ncbi:hypothetical protein [Phenylobacterium aquaticum]|uniref:hypothetical protein n=1 Tax=Phenylobacterium aquaticum TaxID=1763816 RepID=UPI0026ED56FC|nr:hypothetical protein [Phenylobacterium aquaticum]